MAENAALLPRHQMARIDPAAWIAIAPPFTADGRGRLLRDWAERGWPLVGRRPVATDAPGRVPLGLPLPKSLGGQRYAISAPADAITAHFPPPLLADCTKAAPHAWQPALAALVAADPGVRCFGSIAWQHMTGLPYLHAQSDLDLIWTVADRAVADRLARAVAGIIADAPMRIDGEFVLPSGKAVQWSEWESGADEMLVKSADGVAVVGRGAVFA